jgi:hypothetical protein
VDNDNVVIKSSGNQTGDHLSKHVFVKTLYMLEEPYSVKSKKSFARLSLNIVEIAWQQELYISTFYSLFILIYLASVVLG